MCSQDSFVNEEHSRTLLHTVGPCRRIMFSDKVLATMKANQQNAPETLRLFLNRNSEILQKLPFLPFSCSLDY